MAYLEDESGADRVTELLRMAARDRAYLALSWVNAGEVLYIVERERGAEDALRVFARLEELPITLHPADREVELKAARLKARFTIADAHCFAAALAQILGATVVTGDPEFQVLAGEVAVDWLPGKS